MAIFGLYNPKLGSKIYGFCHQRPMGYGLWLTYGLWYAFPCPPSRWTAGAMGYKRLWVFWVMGYDRSDCTSFGIYSFPITPHDPGESHEITSDVRLRSIRKDLVS